MKKILIVYTSKTGTTKKCVNLLKEKLMGEVTVVNLEENNKVEIHDYDFVIIASPIRIGLISSKVKKFIKNNTNKLLRKKFGIFICCAFLENKMQYFTDNIPEMLLRKSVVINTFGGILNVEEQKGIDKFIVNMVAKEKDVSGIKILEENIDSFATKVNESI